MKKKVLTGISFIAIIMIAGLLIGCDKPVEPPRSISIAVIPFSYTGYSVYVAKDVGFFRDNGLDVTLIPYSHGTATLNALNTGEVDFGVSSETPFLRAVLNGSEIYACATLVTADRHLGVVARKDRGIERAGDLAGKTIGVTLGTNGEFFLETVLLIHGVPRESVNMVDIKPKDMYEAIVGGEVDAIATWNPQMYRAEKGLGAEGVVFYSSGFYSPWFLVAAKKDFVQSDPETVKKLLRSLLDSSDYIREHPVQSNKIVSTYLNIDKALLNELSSVYYFSVSLEQALILTLEHQAQWILHHTPEGQARVPVFLEYIYTEGLLSVRPDTVTIIR